MGYAGDTGVGHPDNVQDYAAFATAVAQRHGSKITSYEVWADPMRRSSAGPVDPVAYANPAEGDLYGRSKWSGQVSRYRWCREAG